MGHAHHFLSRLDRVNLRQTELALSFYRDPELLRGVIDAAGVPPHAERVAVALADGKKPPHMVVTRDAFFITCLGAGMFPRGLYRVSYAQLIALSTRLAHKRHRARLCAALYRDRRAVDALLHRVTHAGNTLCREDIAPALDLQPRLWLAFAGSFADHVLTFAHACRPVARLTYAPNGPERDLLRSLWESAWTQAHFSVLMSCEELDEDLSRHAAPAQLIADLPVTFTCYDSAPLLARGLWAVARLGAPALPHLAHWLDYPVSATRVAAQLAAAVVALRHPHLATEALALIDRPDDRYGACIAAEVREELRRAPRLAPLTEVPQRALDRLARRGLIAAPRAEAVPDPMRLALAVSTERAFCRRAFGWWLDLLPALARADAPSLYLPRAWSEAVTERYAVDRGLSLARSFAASLPKRVPHRREARPGRNAPCPCGAGAKYKSCCGRARREVQPAA
ncbi:MAG: SEC-C metal-binding domain-containing protein [Polyangiales bacterium]